MPATSPRYARRRALAAVLITVVLGVVVGVPATLLAPVPSASAVVLLGADGQRTAKADPDLPDFGAAAIGAVGMPGLLAKSGPQKARPIASITKVVTALVVLEAKPLRAGQQGPSITFSDADVAILATVLARQGSWRQVEAGWSTSQRQAIETMLIPSANNYAESLAVWAFGSSEDYLVAAREYLHEHGLDDTTVVDASGLGEGDRSTPADLVDLGKLALAHPVIAATVRTEEIREPNIGEVENTNELLGRHGIDGIKTGTTDEAGACLLFSAKVKVGDRRVRLVGVILGAETHPELNREVPALLKSVRRGLHDLDLTVARETFARYRTAWGDSAKAVTADDASLLVWSRRSVERTAQLTEITSGSKGDRVGTVTYRVDGRTIRVPLVLDRDVREAPAWWRLTNPLR